MKNKAIFLDRDGVINRNMGFIFKKEDISIINGVIETLKILKSKGYKLIVITNQPVVARGLCTEEEIEKLHEFINVKLGLLIDKFYFCPHHPEMHDDVPIYARKYRIKCSCRKPLPGMIFKASEDFNINLKESWMIGDTLVDIAAGKSAGCKTIMIKSGLNNKLPKSEPFFDINIKPDKYVDNIMEVIYFL